MGYVSTQEKAHAVLPENAGYAFPPSPVQERIWELHQAGKLTYAWNISSRFRLIGPLDIKAMQLAVELYVEQHEIFRTILRETDSRLKQIVLLKHKAQVENFDLTHLSEEQRVIQIELLSSQHSTQWLDPSLEPPVRFALIRVQSEEWIFLVCLHQVIADGWTLGLLSDGIGRLYQQLITNRSMQISTPGVAYGDYAAWIQEIFASASYLKHLSYWRRALANRQSTRIPSDLITLPEANNTSSSIFSLLLPCAITDKLESIATSHDSTFHVVTMAAFEVLLSVRSGDHNVLFGTPTASRNNSDFEIVPGHFSNILPIVNQLSPQNTFSSLIDQQQELFQESLEHADCRYEHMRFLSGNNHDNPVRILFQTQKDFVRSAVYGNVCLKAMPSISSGALYDLTFFLVRRPDGWHLSCEVDLSLYSKEYARSLLLEYQALLTHIAEDDNITISRLCELSIVRNISVQSYSSNFFPRKQTFPATPGQIRFHLLETLREEETPNLLLFGFRAIGRLDINALAGALHAIVQQHHALQTTLYRNGAEWLQQINPDLYPELIILQCIDEDHAQSALVQSLTLPSKDGARSLFRMCAVQINPDLSLIGFSLHHTISDGWSAGQLAKDFFESYKSCHRSGIPNSGGNIQPLEIQFADWAVWQSLQNNSISHERKHIFWNQALAAPLSALPIPFCPDQNTSTHGPHGLKTRLLDIDLSNAVKELAISQDSTAFTVYLAAWMCLLYKYSNREDIVCGTPFANRAVHVENTLGPMATALLLRMELSNRDSFISLIERTTSTVRSAIENSLPFEDILPKVKTIQSESRTPLFQHYFYMQRSFLTTHKCGNAEFTPLETLPRSGFAEWELAVIERNEGIRLELHYNLMQYSHRAADAVLDDLIALLHSIIESPARSISSISVSNFSILSKLEGQSHLKEIDAATISVPDLLFLTAREHQNTPLVTSMVQLWRTTFKNHKIMQESDFFSLGGNSLLLAELLFSIKKEYGVGLSPKAIFSAPTPQLLAKLVMRPEESVMVSKNNASYGVVPVQPNGFKQPIFVISQSLIFKEIADTLDKDRPFLALTMSNEDAARLGPSCELEEIAQYYVQQLRSVQPNGPYILGGWCVAAVIAYEVAHQLKAMGEAVDLLILIDSWAPGHWQRIGAMRTFLARWSYRFQRSRRHLSEILNASYNGHFNEFSKRCAYISAGMRREISRRLKNAGLRSSVSKERPLPLREQIEYNAAKKYLGQPYAGNTTLFKSEEQPTGWFIDQKLGWDALLGKECVLQVIPGDHAQMFQGPGARLISETLQHCLNDIDRNSNNTSHQGARN